LDLQADGLEDAGDVDMVFDAIGGQILERSTAVQPDNGRAMFFVIEPDRSRLADLAQRLRDGRLKPIVGAVRPLAEAPAAFAPDRRTPGKTIIRIIEGG
jgi:NADPH:quinone reductase-like Zn-dependent oxidoreductase